MKKAVILLVLTAILTSVMAPAIYASPSTDKGPKHFELSEPVEAFLDSEGLTVVAIDKDGNYILKNEELGYQALMTRGFAEALEAGPAKPGDVSVMVDNWENAARIWSYICSAYTAFCLVREITDYAASVREGRGEEYIPTTMQWFQCCDIINGVVYWN